MKPHCGSTISSECPGQEKLAGYNHGALPPGEIGVLAAHLEDCPNCLKTLLQLDDPDPLLTGLSGQHLMEATAAAEDERLPKHLENLLLSPAEFSSGHAGPGGPDSALPPMQVGPYKVLGALGQGGMGMLYKAQHIHLGQIVALKLLPAARLRDRLAVARFIQEMKAVGQLSHPNIVRASHAEVEGTPYLAMELLEGMDLASLVKERGPLGIPDACEVVRQVALALEHTHAAGLVHRDVKPSNLLLTPEGCVKLLDLGLARLGPDLLPPADEPAASGTITSVGTILGTLDYIAPEQLLDSRSVDIRVDFYGLGCVLYFLLLGHPPSRALGQSTSAQGIRDRRPEAPESLVLVLDRLLAKNPAYRFATPSELHATIRPLAAGSNLPALFLPPPRSALAFVPPVSKPPGSAPAHKPSRLGLWLVGSLVLLAVVMLGIRSLRNWSKITLPKRDELLL